MRRFLALLAVLILTPCTASAEEGLFPVVVSLRGEAEVSAVNARRCPRGNAFTAPGKSIETKSPC